MKKLLLGAAILLLMASCNSNKADQAINDSNKQSEQAEEIKKEYMDSIMNVQIEDEYNKGLTVKAGKENVKIIPESTITKMTLPLIVDNNTSVTWEDGDYEISYSYLTEYWDEEGEEDRWYPKKVKGTHIGPNETITITDKNDGWEFKKVKLKTKLSKEDFAKRFQEHTVFDKDQNKFIPKNQ